MHYELCTMNWIMNYELNYVSFPDFTRHFDIRQVHINHLWVRGMTSNKCRFRTLKPKNGIFWLFFHHFSFSFNFFYLFLQLISYITPYGRHVPLRYTLPCGRDESPRRAETQGACIPCLCGHWAGNHDIVKRRLLDACLWLQEISQISNPVKERQR